MTRPKSPEEPPAGARGPVDRRTALKGLSAATVAPMFPGCSPGGEGSGAGAGSADGLPTELTPELLRERIDTVVVLMMENRSFDHYFGAYSLVEDRDDVDGLEDGMSNPSPDGGVVQIHPADKDCIADPPHGWTSCHNQFAGGANDGFVAEHHARHGAESAHRVMGWYDRSTLSTSYELADSGALCQRWFCSLLSSTWPNRFYSLTGENGGGLGNQLISGSDFDDIFERVDASGRQWANYYGNAPFSMLLPHSRLTDGGYRPLEDFFGDAEAGVLPNLVWIDPIFGRNDDHPPCHPVAGQVLIASIYKALAAGPHWDRCLFVITYDEHGGFFDHVPPPTTVDERASQGFDQLGFRVPSVVLGPWVRSGHVSDTVYDHTSVLAFLSTLWGLEPLTKRVSAANDLTDLLDFDRLVHNTPAAAIELTPIEYDEAVIYADECQWLDGRSNGAGVTGQPELELVLDTQFAGSPHDRRAQTDQIYSDVLAEAERLGVLRRLDD